MAVGCLFLPAALSADVMFVNGSFESPATGSVETNPDGWIVHRVAGGQLPLLFNHTVVPLGPTPYGNQFLVLAIDDADQASWIEQTVGGFVPGDLYRLTVAHASENTLDGLRVTFAGNSATLASTTDTSIAPPSLGGCCWRTWSDYLLFFTANDSDVTFHFQGVPGTSSGNVAIDNLRLTHLPSAPAAVPEPASVVLLVSLVVGMSGMLRRRRTVRDCRN
jgi:hypothetical protein